MSASNKAALILNNWIGQGLFASRYQDYVDELRLASDSWYAREVAKHDKVEAEIKLAEWNQRERMSDFARSLESIAGGMEALVAVDRAGDFSRVIRVGDDMKLPRCLAIENPQYMVTVLNDGPWDYPAHIDSGLEDWGLGGRLGLKALTLEAGYDCHVRPVAQLGLVLPQRNCSSQSRGRENLKEDGFVVVTITSLGHVKGHSYYPHGFRRDGYLHYSMGMLTFERVMLCASSSGGQLDDVVGFPGATQYLADALPALADYLEALSLWAKKQIKV